MHENTHLQTGHKQEERLEYIQTPTTTPSPLTKFCNLRKGVK